jgi:histidinol-phosphatase
MGVTHHVDNSLIERFEAIAQIMSQVHKTINQAYALQCTPEFKDNGSLVTQTDREVEIFIRNFLSQRFPEDGQVGEEFPEMDKKGEYTWYIDPIDGTSSFVHRVPLFGCMLALKRGDDVKMGYIHFPALNETVYAVVGKGTWWSPSFSDDFIRANVGDKSKMSESCFSYSGREYFQLANNLVLLDNLRDQFALERMWGDCYGHMCVATGRLDFMIDPSLAPWDIPALEIITKEAGGIFIEWDVPNGPCRGAISTNSALAKEFAETKKLFE